MTTHKAVESEGALREALAYAAVESESVHYAFERLPECDALARVARLEDALAECSRVSAGWRAEMLEQNEGLRAALRETAEQLNIEHGQYVDDEECSGHPADALRDRNRSLLSEVRCPACGGTTAHTADCVGEHEPDLEP